MRVASSSHRGGPEGDGRVALDVEEVAASQVGVTVVVPGAEAGGADVCLDVGVLRLLGDGDAAADVAEASAHLGDHQVPGDELDRGVRPVDLVDAGDRDEAVVVAAQDADGSS